MKRLSSLILIGWLVSVHSLVAQRPFHGDSFAHTFSIVARDSVTGDVGVAVQSHWFSVGSVVAWAEAGVGAIATQSMVNVSFGPRGLELLKSGLSAQETLDQLISSDDGRDFRQVGIVDIKGNVATYTGAKCIAEAGHRQGRQFSVQANMMLNDKVPAAMERAYRSARGPLPQRLMAALKAAQGVGGDIRGQQSATILVVKGQQSDRPWEDKVVDLRVEDHPNAVAEMERVLNVHYAYEDMNLGDLAMEHNDVPGALKHYGAAMAKYPNNVEMKYWTAVSLANAGRLNEALSIFREVFRKEPNWALLTRRLVPNGMLTVSEAELKKILDSGK
ncbi:DUF1028 domain-containing protein [Telluribacter sp.]|jgi:uncharacterized Ntn-hydrolase superfamily protein|uniref:DUF1028 domain-containing protein n=1 Tax=Telluribacter sp. TaxID=1978767 RepID=UPI002E0DCA4D|nr:DUF1028 domain-containing protein [Telluribacter sp.]